MTIQMRDLYFYFLVYNMIICCYDSALADKEMTNKGLTMTVRAAMEQAVDIQSRAAKLGSEHQVHRDCDDLIDHAILQLNNTLQAISTTTHTVGFAAHDAQTWLSTALTNVQLCRSAAANLNLSHPIFTANVSKLISNSLATNAAALLGTNAKTGYGGFPRWVSGRDRKLLQDSDLKSRANVVVAQDGSGRFGSIQEAINFAVNVSESVGKERVVVYVKKGVYTENILVDRSMENVMLVGDGVRHTVITGNRSASSGFTTYSSATVGVDGSGFIARGITFRNSAGAEGGQAVALRSASDLSVFYACSFEGYQDTLFTHAQRQFYKSCYIYGTVDIIFGNAAVLLQNCVIYIRKPLDGQANMVTAQGRGDPFQNTGISIHSCRVVAAPDLNPVVGSFKTYLGRPWQEYSRTVIMKSYLDDLVDPQGWSKWGDSDFALTSLYYGEYQNFGPGAPTENRVTWPGYHIIMTAKEAGPFTAAILIAGRQWLPATGVPFTIGL
ncbi:hypothetical protein ACS0TY_001268 [Phlomoides rotata]